MDLTPNFRGVVFSDRLQATAHEGAIAPEALLGLLEASPVMGRFLDDHPEDRCCTELPGRCGWVSFIRGRQGQVVLLTVTKTRPAGPCLNLAPLWA